MRTIFVLLIAMPALAATFNSPCKLPFEKIATKQDIDSKCGESGSTDAKPALIAQDVAKNNFCAKGTAFILTFADYPAMQAAGEKALGGANYVPPPKRDVLHKVMTVRGEKIGEGDLVRIAAYVEAAHYSDVSSGEGVNCRLTGSSNNDIHVPLVAKPKENECTSVTAEVSPHFRPTAWSAANLNHPKVPLRFTGQLFFDAEHRPCHNGKASGPKRVSVWEVHPVYEIDVCTAHEVEGCDAANEDVWMPLDQWVASQSAK